MAKPYETYDTFEDYVRAHDHCSLLESDRATLLTTLELAGSLATPVIQNPVTYFPTLDFAVSPLYAYRHLTFAGDWMFGHPVIRAARWTEGFPDLLDFCLKQQRHFLPSAFVIDAPTSVALNEYALLPYESEVIDLAPEYLSSLNSDNRYRVKRAMASHASLNFEIKTEIESTLFEWAREQLIRRRSDTHFVASTVLQLSLAHASAQHGKPVIWLVARSSNGGLPIALLAFVSCDWGYRYQCMVVNTEEYLAGRLSGIGLACLAQAVLRLKMWGHTQILNLIAFSEWHNPSSNCYKKPAANASKTVWTQATLAYPDPKIAGPSFAAYA